GREGPEPSIECRPGEAAELETVVKTWRRRRGLRGLSQPPILRVVRHGRRVRFWADSDRRYPVASGREFGWSDPPAAWPGAPWGRLDSRARRLAVARIHSEATVRPLSRLGPARSDQPRDRRLREEPRSDLRRPHIRGRRAESVQVVHPRCEH